MSILINQKTRASLVQGITGNEGLFHTTQMFAYGTNVVAGVTPGKGGEWVLDGKVPVFDSVKLAVDATGANCTCIFVPARFAPDAMFEAADAGHSFDCLYYGRCAGAGYDARPQLSGPKESATRWSELPWSVNSWRIKSRHYPRRYCIDR